MSIIITRHIPNFVDVDLREKVEVGGVQDLPSIPWIANWTKYSKFSQFSVSTHIPGVSTLMAQFDGGREWWVVGYLSGKLEGLPEWKPERS